MTWRVAVAMLGAAVLASACWRASLDGPCVCERTIGRVDCICEPPLMAPAEPTVAPAIAPPRTTSEPPWRSWIHGATPPPLMLGAQPAEPAVAPAIAAPPPSVEPPWRSWIRRPEPTPATPRPIPTISFLALEPVEGKRSAWVRIGASVPTSGYVGRITMDSDVAEPYTARIHWRGWDTGPADGDSPTQESQIWAVRAGATTVTWSLSCSGECRVGTPASVTWERS